MPSDPTPTVPEPTPNEMAADLADDYRTLNIVDNARHVPTWAQIVACRAIRRAVHAEARADAGDHFKMFVHAYLNSHGVPHGDPENQHQKAGCRIGARLDMLFAERDALRARNALLERVTAAARVFRDAPDQGGARWAKAKLFAALDALDAGKEAP